MRPALTATYRLQLHAGMPLATATRVVYYLARLGVSHLYTSPLLASRRGSRHGYDVVDPTRLDPELGTPDELRGLVRRLRARDMGLVVDVVPNHMALGSENRFWQDVLAHGGASRWAPWFDVAWRSASGRPAPLRLPVLGDSRGRLVARGELRLVLEDGRLRIAYADWRFPLDPVTIAPILGAAARQLDAAAARALGTLADTLDRLPAQAPERGARADWAQRRLARLVRRDGAVHAALARAAGEVRGRALTALLERQAYRLVHWHRAAGDVNYRRFFNVSELVGLRVEDQTVFADTHAQLLAWAADGLLDGVRIDHVDGLADPRTYLVRLRCALDAVAARDVPIIVEKILVGDERLRADWPVAGTTGYEVSNAIDAAFLDARGAASLVHWYRRAIAARPALGFRAVAWAGKETMAASWLAPDVRRLAELLPAAAATAPVSALTRRAERRALRELLVCLPVYRTYLDGRPPAAADGAAMARAVADAVRRGRTAPAMLRHIADLLLEPGPLAGARGEFVRRFQQVSGALMAKGVEDTALYRWVPLASRNEVGGDPGGPLAGAMGRLHRHLRARAVRWPRGLSTVTTHDTKRSADARARLHVLSEMPARWAALVASWRRRHRAWRRSLGGRRMPDPVTEYLFYQSVVALWPLPASPSGPGELAAVGERVRAYMQKAVREAGVHTTWLAPAPDFEEALDAFVVAVLGSATFRADVTALVAEIGRPGLWTALARTLVHLTAPGVPDLYQGDELWSFTLVDPDNRGDVDFARRDAMLAALARRPVDPALARELVATPDDGRPKLHAIRCALALRRRSPEVFAGPYLALERGRGRLDHVFAFARTAGPHAALTIVPRLVLSLMHGRPDPPLGPAVWQRTALRLPPALARRRFTNVLTGEPVATTDALLDVGAALATFPAALLWTT